MIYECALINVDPIIYQTKKTNMVQNPKIDNLTQQIPALQEFALKFTNDLDSAKDLVQDTMLKAIRFYARYEDGTNIRAWLFTIMRNTFINGFKRNVAINAIITQSESLNYSQLMMSSTVNGCDNRLVMKDIRHALSKLPEYLCKPFIRYIEGYKYYEIALESNAPIGTIKTRIFEARRLLKKQLADYSAVSERC